MVESWDGTGGAALLLVPARNGALSRSALLVLLAGGFMGFSRELGSPEMVIIGRSITGLHSGGCCLGCAQTFPHGSGPYGHSRVMEKASYSPKALWRGSLVQPGPPPRPWGPHCG